MGRLGGPGSGLATPSGIDVGPEGLVYVTDPDTDSVHVLDPEGESHRSWGGYGSGDGQFQNPWAIAVRDDGTVVVGEVSHRVQQFDPDGRFLGKWTVPGADPSGGPSTLEASGDNLYLSSEGLPTLLVLRVEGPDLSIVGPNGPTNNRRPVFTVSSQAEGTRFECALAESGQEPRFEPCEGASYQPEEELADGDYTFAVRGTDQAGDRSTARREFTVDTVPPNTTITKAPRKLGNDPDPVFEFAADKPGSSFQCRLDGGGWEVCSSPHSYEGLADGEHILQVRATDPAGNREDTQPAYAFTIDTVAPQVTITSGPSGDRPVRTRSVEFGFRAEKPGAPLTLECRLDGGEWELCASPQRYGKLADGEHAFSVRATDPAGNQAEESREFRVEAGVCERAGAELKRAQAKVQRTRKAVSAAQKKLSKLKRKRAAEPKIKRASKRLTKAKKALRRAKADLKRAQKEHQARCS